MLMFADGLVLIFDKGERLQREMFQFNEIRNNYNTKISQKKWYFMESSQPRTKTVIADDLTERP
jgi:hypothetical protein